METRRQGGWKGFKSRHPNTARALRNLAITGAVVAPIALSSRGKFQSVMRGRAAKGLERMGRSEAKHLLGQANRRRRAAMMIGTAGVVGGAGSPFERWYAGKQDARRTRQSPHRVLVVSRKTRQQRYIEM
jgi:hypothetical protein